MQDNEGAREEARGLASKSLLQDVGGGGYRVHDLVLGFMKARIEADTAVGVEKATTLQAHYLARLDVVESYRGADHHGLFVLGTLWRSVEELSGNQGLEVASYRVSLGELEACEATAEVANSYSSVGLLFGVQVRQVSSVLYVEEHHVVVACSLCSWIWRIDALPYRGRCGCYFLLPPHCLLRHSVHFFLYLNRVDLQDKFTAVFTLGLTFALCTSNVHRVSTTRQFHFSREHALSMGKNWEIVTRTRLAQIPPWSVCDSISLSRRLVEKLIASRNYVTPDSTLARVAGVAGGVKIRSDQIRSEALHVKVVPSNATNEGPGGGGGQRASWRNVFYVPTWRASFRRRCRVGLVLDMTGLWVPDASLPYANRMFTASVCVVTCRPSTLS